MNDNKKNTLQAANDNGEGTQTAPHPMMLKLAHLMGQQAAREWLDSFEAANDNKRVSKPGREV